MKVVLFCGGLGLRLRDYADHIPKPMVNIGYRPILWHVMKYYAHFGHKDFILCLGYRGDLIKEYFLTYNEYLSNDFVLSKGGKHLALAQHDIRDWRISFVDTGTTTKIGQRLKAVQHHLHGEGMFLANYSDGLSDLSLPALLDDANAKDKVATFVSVRPNLSYQVVYATKDGLVSEIKELGRSEIRINAGYFVFKQTIFDYLQADEELVKGPFDQLISEQQLARFSTTGSSRPWTRSRTNSTWTICMNAARRRGRFGRTAHAAGRKIRTARTDEPGERRLPPAGMLDRLLSQIRRTPPRLLCLGAHCDDIEIGCGGSLLRMTRDHPGLEVHWVVFSAPPERERETRNAARVFLRRAGARWKRTGSAMGSSPTTARTSKSASKI